MSEKIAVQCKTEKEWEAVKSKLGCKNLCTFKVDYHRDNACIYTNYKGWDRQDDCLLRGYTVISAAEYLEELDLADRIDVQKVDLCGFCEGQFENMSRDRCEGSRCTEAHEMYLEENNLIEPKKEETMLQVNSTIRKVFKGEDFELVEKMQHHFHDEIPETFTGEINLIRDKKKYISEIERRDEEAAKVAEALAK